jgi:ATP-dependent DNA ligase
MRKQKQETKSVMLAPNKIIPLEDPRITYATGIVGALKYDGNRNFCRDDGTMLTRNMLDQPNKHINTFLADMAHIARTQRVCFDMEIFDPTATHHGKISGWLNASKNAKPIPDHWRAYVFDAIPAGEWERGIFVTPFARRYELYRRLVPLMNERLGDKRYIAVRQRELVDADAARAFYEESIASERPGIEGIMLRSTLATYEAKRVGHKGCALLKVKEAETTDARIVEVVQMRKMREGIERTRNGFGRLETPTRNSENYTVQNNVGALVVELPNGVRCEVMFAGPCKANPEGWPLERRQREIWKPYKDDPSSIIGRMIEFTHFPVGAKDKARSGRMIRFRPDKD